MKKVEGFKPKRQTVDELVKQMRMTAFNARRLGEAVDVIEGMIKDKSCIKFLGLSGALVPAGMGNCVMEMIKNKWIDVIVSTGSNITHDLERSMNYKYFHCDPRTVDDTKMKEKGYSRIYDVFSETETLESIEKDSQRILGEIPEGTYSTFEILSEIGKRLKNKDCILGVASENGVKIIVPAFFDSILGFQVWMRSQDHKILIDERKDLDYLINLHYDLKNKGKSSGALILGGGVPKNFILQAVLIPEKPHKYAVQITTDQPTWGGLSGATLEEAVSWGKLDKKSRHCVVYCDATIAFPIIVSSLKERLS